jgi:nucleoside-diphosphate-sugar epimerase
MKRILLIGNKGSFFIEVYNGLRAIQDTCISSIIICRGDNIALIYTNFWNLINSLSYDEVIYIGGETRDEDLMKDFNYLLPIKIFNLSKMREIRFIYLSSLSIYEGEFNPADNLDIERLSTYTVYGSTKLILDQEIKRSKYCNYVSIRPASIFSGRGRSSIEKLATLSENNFLFKNFKFPGVVTYIPLHVLVDEICRISSNANIMGFINLAQYISILDVQEGVLKRYRSPIWIPKILLKFFFTLLPFKIASILKTLFGRVYYP